MNLRHTAVVSLSAILLVGCSTTATDAKRAPDILAHLRQECDNGKQSACVDMVRLHEACWGHSSFGGLNFEDTQSCAYAVRNAQAVHPEIRAPLLRAQ
jgi:hypothetical protein